MTLSCFIKRNLFIPLQLRLTRWTDAGYPLLVASLSYTVAFVICGLWHGINLRWFAWGLYQAVGFIIWNTYRTILARRLGREGMKRYRESTLVRIAATLLMFEYFTVSLVIIMSNLTVSDLWRSMKMY